jgi:hypothetical protein
MLDDLILEIDEELKKIKEHPEYSTRINNMFLKRLNEESKRHSLEIENINTKEVNKFSSLYIKSLNNAYNILLNEGINLSTLSRLGNLVEPIQCPYSTFKFKDNRFGEFYAPEKEKVPYLVNDLCDFLNKSDEHPIKKSIEAHIRMVMIHPYQDGNGRASRLLSNYILISNNYPTYIINKHEKERYFRIINNALRKRFYENNSYYNQSLADEAFAYYLGLKILESTKNLTEYLDKKNNYQIDLSENKELKLIQRELSSKLRNCAVKHNKLITVNKNKLGVIVRGDIDFKELDNYISNYKKYIQPIKFEYEIKKNKLKKFN